MVSGPDNNPLVLFALESDLLEIETDLGEINTTLGSVATSVTNDTNVTGSIVANVLQLGWQGTLAAGRLNANVVQAVTNDTNVTGSIAAQTITLGWTGTLAAGRLNANVVQAITNDTNITGSIAAQNLTLAWAGTLAVARGGTGGGVASGTLLDNISAFAGTGLLARTGTGAYSFRTVTGTTNRVAVTNGSGVAGNPTIDIDAAYVGQSSITTLGTITTGTWNGTAIANANLATMANLTLKSNISGGVAAPSDNTLTAILDAIIGSSRGSLLVRGLSTWGVLTLGTNTQVLTSNGTDAVWAPATGGGGGSGGEPMALYGVMGGL